MAHGASDGPYVVTFPGGWTRQEAGSETAIISVPFAWDVRRGASGWLFRVKGVDGHLSDQCFGVRAGTAPSSRRVAAAECEGAPRIEAKGSLAAAAAAVGFQGVLYRNRQYAMGGGTLGKALLSPGGRWLAVVSDTPSEDPRTRSNPMAPLAGGEPSRGELFLDVYDTTTGEAKARSQSPFAGFGPRIVFAEAFWAGDLFVMPLNLLADRCFLVDPELP